MRTIHQYLCTVIPPHILRHVAEHGDEDDKQTIGATLARTEELRQDRRTLRAFLGAQPSPGAPLKKRRNVYDAGHRYSLPGHLILSDRKGPNPNADEAATEAFAGSGATFQFYANVFGRNSIDDRGMRIDATVHYGKQFDNALWNGRQMVYGDGDGKLFNRFTVALDVIGHELTHGVTQYTAALNYSGQTGALNEHISDAFGIMVKQNTLGLDASQSDWLIGAGLLGPQVNGKAVRSMAQPGTAYDDPVLGRDPQPAHMRDYVLTTEDRGGVHINCGIPNRAFYLAAIAAGGRTWDVVGRIWYSVLTQRLGASAKFQDFANATFVMAGELFGTRSREQRFVGDAWFEVGLPPSLAVQPRIPVKAAPQERPAALRGSSRPQKWRKRPAANH
jgi:Zn-dependent metalloprotease